jgi:hypothetical protein
MFPADAYTIGLATDEDADTLRRLAALDSRPQLRGRVLLAEDDMPVAALAVDDGRSVADPFRRTDMPLVLLRLRASALVSHEPTPSPAERIRAGYTRRLRFPGTRRRVTQMTITSHAGSAWAACEPAGGACVLPAGASTRAAASQRRRPRPRSFP